MPPSLPPAAANSGDHLTGAIASDRRFTLRLQRPQVRAAIRIGAGVVPPVGGEDVEAAVFMEAQAPTALMNGVVMLTAEGHQVAEIGCAAVLPLMDMVELAPRQGAVTAVPGAGAVHGSNGNPLGRGGGAMATPDVDRNTSLIENDALNHRIAGQTGDRLRRHGTTSGGLSNGVGMGPLMKVSQSTSTPMCGATDPAEVDPVRRSKAA